MKTPITIAITICLAFIACVPSRVCLFCLSNSLRAAEPSANESDCDACACCPQSTGEADDSARLSRNDPSRCRIIDQHFVTRSNKTDNDASNDRLAFVLASVPVISSATFNTRSSSSAAAQNAIDQPRIHHSVPVTVLRL